MNVLVRIGSSTDGWDTLYRDPGDNRLWELLYPQGHMQGGGPPTLRQISGSEAQAKYDLDRA
ncbi:MAG: Imm27 family immunity protein [Phycisphaerales bacterium]